MTSEEREQAKRQAAGNRTVLRLIDFWRAMETLLADGGPRVSGWVTLATVNGEHGPVRALHLRERKPVREGWQVPTLHLDATMNVDLLRPFWPQIRLVADIAVETPYMRVRQVTDRTFSKAMLEQVDDRADRDADAKRDAKRRANNLRKLHATLHREVRRYAPEGQTLVVAQLAVEKALLSIGPLPRRADTAHHNAVAGRDEWRDVRGLIVVGRTMPRPRAVERIAEALTGSAIQSIDRGRWFDRADATREIVSGTWPNQTTQLIPAEADRHPDPIAEAVRWQIAEGELVQIIGRGRGVNRTADNPLDILVLTDVPIPVPVCQTLSAKDIEPSLLDLMLALGGIAYENPTDRSAAYPYLWPTRGAAEQAINRERSHTNSYKYTPYRRTYETSGLVRIEYQLIGPGKRPCAAWVDPTIVVDFEAGLTAHLGPLAWCKLQSPPRQPAHLPHLGQPAIVRVGLGICFVLPPGTEDDPSFDPFGEPEGDPPEAGPLSSWRPSPTLLHKIERLLLEPGEGWRYGDVPARVEIERSALPALSR